MPSGQLRARRERPGRRRRQGEDVSDRARTTSDAAGGEVDEGGRLTLGVGAADGKAETRRSLRSVAGGCPGVTTRPARAGLGSRLPEPRHVAQEDSEDGAGPAVFPGNMDEAAEGRAPYSL